MCALLLLFNTTRARAHTPDPQAQEPLSLRVTARGGALPVVRKGLCVERLSR